MRDCEDELKGFVGDDRACWFMAQEIKVVAIPPSEFYCREHLSIGEKFARFAFVSHRPLRLSITG